MPVPSHHAVFHAPKESDKKPHLPCVPDVAHCTALQEKGRRPARARCCVGGLRLGINQPHHAAPRLHASCQDGDPTGFPSFLGEFPGVQCEDFFAPLFLFFFVSTRPRDKPVVHLQRDSHNACCRCCTMQRGTAISSRAISSFAVFLVSRGVKLGWQGKVYYLAE